MMASSLAALSRLAYLDGDAAGAAHAHFGFDVVAEVTAGSDFCRVVRPVGPTADDVAVVAFEGTNSGGAEMWRDWNRNKRIARWWHPATGWCQRGHYGGAKGLWRAGLADAVDDQARAGRHVIFTGHSRGGGLAQLAGLWLRYDFGWLPDCVTFGSPRVMMASGVARWQGTGMHARDAFGRGKYLAPCHRPHTAAYRHVGAVCDPVPGVMPSWWWMPYQHLSPVDLPSPEAKGMLDLHKIGLYQRSVTIGEKKGGPKAARSSMEMDAA